ncbi:sugar-binding domain-containing protein [uncultured Paracoccus sp.]|uniref:sugar-binding domain-containing protein n=1 Tax=uncultured Paracoccus sp. TaxID=189685 RepID=UPI0025D116A6|nr:sugar-binding domain-containing protein [uncultured Paracoccus sp.]
MAEIFDLANGAGLKVAGMGTVDPGAQLVASGMIEPREIAEIRAGGGVGEMMGHFFDADGRVLHTTLSARTLAAALDEPGASRTVVIAGGPDKVQAIRAALNSRRLRGLITDEATAEALAR